MSDTGQPEGRGGLAVSVQASMDAFPTQTTVTLPKVEVQALLATIEALEAERDALAAEFTEEPEGPQPDRIMMRSEDCAEIGHEIDLSTGECPCGQRTVNHGAPEETP